MEIILASASPRRRELLERSGVSVRVEPADIDESHRDGESARDYVHRMACTKAAHVAEKHGTECLCILAADTIVVRDGEILGKPLDRGAAAEMLRSLSGRGHEVMTAVCAVCPGLGRTESFVCETHVQFGDIHSEQIDSYVASGEPMDKAGAYGIQGGAAGFVERIEGSYTNVVGLPLYETLQLLERLSDKI